jgi:hypothetical protein
MVSVSQVHRAFSNEMIFTAVRQLSSTDVSNFGPHFLKNDPAGHFEKQPYDKSTMRSIYHIREYNVRRLSLVSKKRPTDG